MVVTIFRGFTLLSRDVNRSVLLVTPRKWTPFRGIMSTATIHQYKDIDAFAKHDNAGHATTDYTNKNVLRSKETSQLWRSLFILKISSIDSFVSHADKILLFARKYVWSSLYDKIMMKTFYGQFASGESIETSKETVDRLKKSGIRTMLMVPIETVIHKTEIEEEKALEANFNSMKGCILGETVLENNGFSQLKLTALCNKKLLLEMNKLLIKYEKDHKEPAIWDIEVMASNLEDGKYEKIYIPELGDQLNKKLQVLLKRINDLAESCKTNNVRMMIDAEQTYLQAALGYLVLVLQAKFNKKEPLVYNTYQCFRKDTLDRLKADCDLAEYLGFKNAGKLVRGAYMVEERRLAKEGGYDDPINDTFEDTTKMYHSCVDYMLPMVKKGDAGVMVATHNENTVDFVKGRIAIHGIAKDSNYFCFGQIYGMCDHVSYSLAEEGYKPFKSVPYGPIDDTILYLSRRAQENRSVMERTKFERQIIRAELKKRMKGRLMLGSMST